MIRMLLFAFGLLLTLPGMAQNRIYQQVRDAMSAGKAPGTVAALTYVSQDVQDRAFTLEGVEKGTVMAMVPEVLQQINADRSQFDLIRLRVPVKEREDLVLLLQQHDIFTQDFKLFASHLPGQPLDYRPGVHYKGIVEGDPHSVVAVSIFNTHMMALISQDHGNAMIGPIEGDRENRHIYFLDKDLKRTPDFSCEMADDGIGYTEDQLKPFVPTRDAGDCVRLYIEIDDDIVTQKGGAGPATDYITGLFNQSIVLYNNESINMSINEILAWTTNSPYTGGTSSAMLSSYQANTGSFNGDLSHLVSYAASGGIAAGFNGICNANPDLSKCFSSIDATYATVPTYSWSVMVVTHEMGHLIGSRHTHACVWNGNNTAIDGCSGAVEGTCPLPGIPSGGGTMMSYCHLQSVGINFNLGFGPQPGNVIRNTVNATGNCLTACGPPPPPPPPSYCASNGSNSSYEWINNVNLGSISNTSGNNGGYANFTAQSTTLTPGTSYTITLTPGFSGTTYTEYWRVWIDYNGDLDWADAGEQVGQGTGTGVVTINFTVPAGLSPDTTRMRVTMQYNAYPTYCGTFTYGEVEDYTIIIGGGGGPTCSDGIQNQGETGIDCGGPCPPCDPPGETVLLASYFETGWDSWADGGADATRVSSANSWEGSYSIRLADNSGTQSAMTSPTFNLSDATGAEIEFYFYAFSMEVGEDFWVRYYNGSTWSTIATFTRGTNFNNNTFYVTTVTVPNFSPTTAGAFRIQCDASDNNDQIFIDQVTITKLTGSGLIESDVVIEAVTGPTPPAFANGLAVPEAGENLYVYPNPTRDVLNISCTGQIQNVRLMASDGKMILVPEQTMKHRQLDIQSLAPGIYVLWVQTGEDWHPVRFNKM